MNRINFARVVIGLVSRIKEQVITVSPRKKTNVSAPTDVPLDLLPITPLNPPSTIDLRIQSYSSRKNSRTSSKSVSSQVPSLESKETSTERIPIRGQLLQNLQALHDQLEVLSVSTASNASKHNTNSSSSNKDTVSTISMESVGKSSLRHTSSFDIKNDASKRRTLSMSVDDPWAGDLLLDSAGLGISSDHEMLGLNFMASNDLMNTGTGVAYLIVASVLRSYIGESVIIMKSIVEEREASMSMSSQSRGEPRSSAEVGRSLASTGQSLMDTAEVVAQRESSLDHWSDELLKRRSYDKEE